mgnify:CR=1 FL=1
MAIQGLHIKYVKPKFCPLVIPSAIRHGAPFQIPAQDNQLNGQHHGA